MLLRSEFDTERAVESTEGIATYSYLPLRCLARKYWRDGACTTGNELFATPGTFASIVTRIFSLNICACRSESRASSKGAYPLQQKPVLIE